MLISYSVTTLSGTINPKYYYETDYALFSYVELAKDFNIAAYSVLSPQAI